MTSRADGEPILEVLRAAVLAYAVGDERWRSLLREFNERSGLAGTPGEVISISEERSSTVNDASATTTGHAQDFRDANGDRLDALSWLERLVGADVLGVRKLGRQHARWQLVIARDGEDVTVELGTSGDVLRPDRFRAAIFDATGRVPALARGDSQRVAAALGELAEVVDAVMTTAEKTREWLTDYGADLATCDPRDPAELYDQLGGFGGSFRSPDGRVYLRLPDLAQHVQLSYGQRTSHKDLSARLGDLGFERDQLAARPPGGGRERKARYWVSPPDFDPGG